MSRFSEIRQSAAFYRRLMRHMIAGLALVALTASADAQRAFPTAEGAAEALVAALRSEPGGGILDVVGRAAFDILSSGDDVADAAARKRFVEDYAQKHRVVMHGDREATLLVGSSDVAFPIPLVRTKAGWQFDMATGRQDLLRARIARNEAKAIEASLAFVAAQESYAAMTEKDGDRRYAQRIISRPGLKDGLYWPATNGQPASPLSKLVDRAAADGYKPRPRSDYYGYRFKVLMKQGPKASGGSFDYSERGKMIHGFALIAYPVQYGHSGVLTFMVNQRGIVYQKDLGAYTTRFANREIWFNPDQTWRQVQAAGGK
jgi:hypothetical protein